MKKLFIVLTAVTFSSLTFTQNTAFGQDVFGQEVRPSTISPEEMEYEDLPEAVRMVIERDEFNGLVLDKVYSVGPRKAAREKHYTIRFKKGNEYEDVYLDNQGNIIDPQDEMTETLNPKQQK